jgi:hypothetical protein
MAGPKPDGPIGIGTESAAKLAGEKALVAFVQGARDPPGASLQSPVVSERQLGFRAILAGAND